MATEELALAAGFPAATKADWQRLVGRVLHGAGSAAPGVDEHPELELATRTLDGIDILPLYTGADLLGSAGGSGFPGQAPFVRGRTPDGHRAGWDVRQLHGHPDPGVAGEQILADLEGGVSSVWLRLGAGATPVEALPQVLADVYLDLAPVVLDAGNEALPAAEAFLALAHERGVAPDQLSGCLGIDPLGLAVRTGEDRRAPEAAPLALRCSRELPGMRAVVVDGLAFHEAGGTDVEELGCALAAGVEYLRALVAGGLTMAAALAQLEFRFAATADQFATIAKFRAARRLWSRVAQSCGESGPVAGQRQHAVTSWTMTTRRDPWNNILRATLACLAAAVGGADAITVLPFDAALGLPDTLARRVARNTHALLAEESHVARVIDPAGGSFYVDTLTDQVARHAWSWFQEIERAGGLSAALAGGLVADKIGASRDARRSALAHRDEAITGVSEFPLLGEQLLTREPAGPSRSTPAGLPRIRWAQWHEELRDRADTHEALTGRPPTVALVPVGAARGSAARADAVGGLLAPAGIVTAVVAAAPAGAVVCLCCAADAGPEQIAEAIAAARAAGPARLVLAGPPAFPDAAGADETVGEHTDVLAWSTRMLDSLGVA